jgi:predicted DNA-binding ribbon-helix-helix protein
MRCKNLGSRKRFVNLFVFQWPPFNFMGAAVTDSRLINRNVVARRGRTSMRLEPELWEALTEIGAREGKDVSTLVRKVEVDDYPGGRTSAVRVFVLAYFREAAIETGHAEAGHGAMPRTRTESPMRSSEMPPPMLEEARDAA